MGWINILNVFLVKIIIINILIEHYSAILWSLMINIHLKLIILSKKRGWCIGLQNLKMYGKICLMVTYLKIMFGITFYWIILQIIELLIFSIINYSISIWNIQWDSSIWMEYLLLKLQIKLLMGIKILL